MQDLKLAVLIDADNISPKYVKVILDEAASFGVAACKRIYGDWSDTKRRSRRISASVSSKTWLWQPPQPDAQLPQPVQPLIKVPPFPGRARMARPCLCP